MQVEIASKHTIKKMIDDRIRIEFNSIYKILENLRDDIQKIEEEQKFIIMKNKELNKNL